MIVYSTPGWWRAWAWLLNPEGEGGEVDEEGDGKTRRDDVLQLLESQRASVGEVKAEAEERELELMTKVELEVHHQHCRHCYHHHHHHHDHNYYHQGERAGGGV